MKARSTSSSTSQKYGLKRVCLSWGLNRSTIYAKRKKKNPPQKRGPKPKFSDDKILMEIRRDLHESPFREEGHKKVHARLRHRRQIIASRERVRKIMREHGLLSPHRAYFGEKKKHEGKIITESPNILWATDALKVGTVEDGMVWFFGILEHWNAECLGWRLSKRGDRFTALDALSIAMKGQFGSIGPNCAKGLSLRPDHGSQFTSRDYRNQLKYWGITPSYSLVREPETNGVVERFHRTLREQIIHGRIYRDIDELREAISSFIKKYNKEWLLQKLGYLSPHEARKKWEENKVI